MSFKVEFPDGKSVYINGCSHSVNTTYRQLENKAIDMAARYGGNAYYESGMPRFQKDGVDLFDRWVPLDADYPQAEKDLKAKYDGVRSLLNLSKEDV